jgi:hypothetical protein
LKASFISREYLISANLASGRPDDLGDVDAIRKAAEGQRPKAIKKSYPKAALIIKSKVRSFAPSSIRAFPDLPLRYASTHEG